MRTLRFLVGAAAAFLVWWYGTLVYNGLLSAGAERLLAVDARLCGPHLIADGRNVEVHPRLCVAPTATIPADQLTYNLILFAGLFAMRFRSVQSFLASFFVLVVTHVLSLAVSVESTYAGRQGPWSDRHFSAFQQNLWISIEFWWRLAGMFAIVFALWWLTLGPVFQPSREKSAPRPKKSRR